MSVPVVSPGVPTPNPPPVWDSGIGGAQCDECGEFTIVRHFGTWDDEDDQMLCRACVEGWDNYDGYDE